MDDTKCKALKAELAAQSEPQIVAAERFFDGNDDLGSIGCNLMEHPGVDAFRDAFVGLLRRPDVQAVYAQISELDPGEVAGLLRTPLWLSARSPPGSYAPLSAVLSRMRSPTQPSSASPHPLPRGMVHLF